MKSMVDILNFVTPSGGTTENSPAIHRWATAQDKESPIGTKEILFCFLAFEPKRPVVPAGLCPQRPYPSDESLVYSLSPCGLDGFPFRRKQRRTDGLLALAPAI